eukprot:Transcript_19797.p1 GENE.Transcript_19797~~Transcript_19797.p1  ORF type:complete len:463 (-),score=158.82 Transcript_19797:376-1764(-)
MSVNLLLPELWTSSSSQCAEWGTRSSPSFPGVSIHADRSGGGCMLRFREPLPAALDVTLRLTKGAACSNHAVLLTTAASVTSLDQPFGPEDAGVLLRWDCERKQLLSADGTSSSTVCSRLRDYEARISLTRSGAVFADDVCDELRGPLAFDQRPLHLFLGIDCARAAARGAARDACGSRTAFSFAELREPCGSVCGGHGEAVGSRLFNSPSLRGCSCRCDAGYVGAFCEQPLSPGGAPPNATRHDTALALAAAAAASADAFGLSAAWVGCRVQLSWRRGAAAGGKQAAREGGREAVFEATGSRSKHFVAWSANGSLLVRPSGGEGARDYYVVSYDAEGGAEVGRSATVRAAGAVGAGGTHAAALAAAAAIAHAAEGKVESVGVAGDALVHFEATAQPTISTHLSLRGRVRDVPALTAALAEAASQALGRPVQPEQLTVKYEPPPAAGAALSRPPSRSLCRRW